MSLSDRLKKFDSHSSVSKEFRVYTVQGAVLSVITVLLIAYLVVSEAYFNFQVTIEQRVHVNATSARGVQMEFDISLHNVRCSELNVDAQDPTGQSQSLHLDRKHHVWKHRVEMHPTTGRVKRVLGKRRKLELGSTLLDVASAVGNIEEKMEELAELEEERAAAAAAGEGDEEEDDEVADEYVCGSCYGAGEPGECCNTCEDVKRAYKIKGWGLKDFSTVEQCKDEDSDNSEEKEGEGCNVHGVVALDSGGGNLHLAPGEEMSSGIQHSQLNLFDLLLQKFHEWNVTHTIHKLRFGPEYPDAKYQLDGEVRTITDTHGMYQYYVQIVPTQYRYLNGTTIQTNQYSVTEHLRHVTPGSNRGLPGVYFIYEVSPLHVEISEEYRKGWIAFFTSVCAVVGGVVTVMGLLDQYLFSKKGRTGELAR